MNEVIENIEKIGDDLYRYSRVQTKVFQTNVEALNREKALLIDRMFNIEYLLSEIQKLNVV